MMNENERMDMANAILSNAERSIENETGMKVAVIMVPRPSTSKEDMMRMIAATFFMTMDDLKTRRKANSIVFVRFSIVKIIKDYYPKVTWSWLGEQFGKDHTTCMHAYEKAVTYIETEDASFMAVYLRAKKAVEAWTGK